MFKAFRTPKVPTLDEAAKHTAQEWKALEQIAREKLRAAENSRARQHQMDRISFCQIAATKAAQ